MPIYKTFNGTLLHNLNDSQFPIKILPNGKYMTQTSFNSLTIWDSNNNIPLTVLSSHTDKINSLAVLSNGFVASGSKDNTVKIWNPMNGQLILTLIGHDNSVHSLVELPDKTLASACECTVNIWNITNGNLLRQFNHDDQHNINGLVLLKDGRLAIQQDLDECFYGGSACNISPFVNILSKVDNSSLKLTANEGTNLLFLAQLSDARLVFSGYYNLYVYNLSNSFLYSWSTYLSSVITFLIELSKDTIATGINDGIYKYI